MGKKIREKGIYTKGKYTFGKKGKPTKEYTVWLSMLTRCYNDKFLETNATYIGCTVCDEWLNLQVFGKWCDKNYIDGYQLDKDLIVKGNKIYSPETCCFVPQEVNLALIKPMRKRELPLGVYKNHNKFVSHIKYNKVSKYMGIFSTIEEAANCYKQAKKKQLAELAMKYKELLSENSYNALLNYTIN